MGKVPLQGYEHLEYDEELSFKSFVNQDVSHIDFNGKVIYSSLFYHEKPNSEPFPMGMSGAKFIKCNLDNLLVPEGNDLIESYNRWFEAQGDGQDWYVYEDDLTPIAPFNYKTYLKNGEEIPTPSVLEEQE